MAREYRTAPSGASAPSPMSFGSANLNLQSPVYRAQTAVDMGVNVFDQLQNILGLGAQVASGIMDLKTQKIKEKMNYDTAVATVQRQRAEESRRQQTQEIAVQRETAEARGSMIGVKLAREAAIAAGLPEQISAGTASVRALETAIEKKAYDAAQSTQAAFTRQMASFEDVGDIEQLGGFYRGFMEKADQESDPRMQKLYTDLAMQARASIGRVEASSEKKAKEAEVATVAAMKSHAEPLVDKAIDILNSDPLILQGIAGSNPEAVRRSLFDYVTDSLMQDEVMLETLLVGTEAEQQAIEQMIFKKIDSAANDMTDIMSETAKRQAYRIDTEAIVGLAVDGPGFDRAIEAADNKTMDGWNSDQIALVKRKATDAFIKSGQTSVDRLRNANVAASSSDLTVQSRANAEITKLNSEISSNISISRNILEDPSVKDRDETAAGWLRRFQDQDDLVRWVVTEKLGVRYEDYLNNPEMLGSSASIVSNVVKQWNEDSEKTRIQRNRADALASKVVDINDRFRATPFGRAVMAGDTDSFQNGDSVAIEIMQAQQGQPDVMPPDDLVKFVKESVGNPQAWTTIKEFWKVHSPGTNGSISAMLAEDGDLQLSWSLGQFLAHAESTGEYDQRTLQGAGMQFIQNLKTYRDPAKRSAMGIEFVDQMNNAVQELAQGSSFEGRILSGDFRFKLKETTDRIQSSDRLVLARFAEIAASIPNISDRGAFMSKMMRDSGYQLVPTNNGQSADLIMNRYVDDAGRSRPVLPSNEVMGSVDWQRYVRSKIPAIQAHLASLPSIDGIQPFRSAEQTGQLTISINPLDADLAFGKCAVSVVTKGGMRYTIPADVVSVTERDYAENWVRLSKDEKYEKSYAAEYESDWPATIISGAAAIILGGG